MVVIQRNLNIRQKSNVPSYYRDLVADYMPILAFRDSDIIRKHV